MTAFKLAGPADRAAERVSEALRRAADDARSEGLGVPEISGKLLRPMIAWALAPDAADEGPGAAFAAGALAVQTVHEASLLHDDILDDAEERRGAPSFQSRAGIGAALVMGDRWLTSAYVVAGRTGSTDFVGAFARAVERTVAGEMRQGATRGQFLSEDVYEAIIRGKSGELFGAAAVLASVTGGREVPVELGLRIGSLYQRIDDLLDYCTEIEQDKPALQDWRQRKWTFPLGLAGIDGWDLDEATVLTALRSGPTPPLIRAVRDLEARADAIATDAQPLVGDGTLLRAVLESWCTAARVAVERELEAAGARPHATPVGSAR